MKLSLISVNRAADHRTVVQSVVEMDASSNSDGCRVNHEEVSASLDGCRACLIKILVRKLIRILLMRLTVGQVNDIRRTFQFLCQNALKLRRLFYFLQYLDDFNRKVLIVVSLTSVD